MCVCVYIYIYMFVYMYICPLTLVVSEKWDGDGFHQKSNWSLTLGETSEDPLVLVHLKFLTLPTIHVLVVPCS